MNTKFKYKRALFTAVLLMQGLSASADVIYREVFAAIPGGGNFLSTTAHWGWAANTTGGVLMATGDANAGFSDLNTPSNLASLPAVNSGTIGTTPASNGRTAFFGNTFLTYTDEYVVNRQLNDITTVTWDQRGTGPALSFAVQINGVWYASATLPNPSPSPQYNVASLDFKNTTWQVLNFVPGSALALVPGTVTLPTQGNITAFGIYCPSGGGNGVRLDGVTINADPIVIANNQWSVGNGDWDTTSLNWKDGGVGAFKTYIDTSVVTLNDNATSDPVLINLTADRSPITVTVDSTKNYTLSGSAIAGTTPLAKAGSSVLTLNNANTYGGATTITGGTIRAGVANAIPSGAGKADLVVAGGALVAGTFDVNGLNVAINGLSGGAGTVPGTVLNNAVGAGTLTLGNGNATASYGGVLADGTGVLSLVKVGTGLQTLTGVNTYTGTTTVSSGSLVAGLATALPGYQTPGKVIFNGGTLAATIGNGTSTGWTSAQVDTLLSNATKTNGALGIDTTSGSIAQAAAFNAANLVGGIGLTKLGTNTLTLDQANTYAGTTTVSAGTLRLGNTGGSTLPDTGTVLVDGGTLDVAANDTIGTLTLASGTVSSSSVPASVLTAGTYDFTTTGTATYALPLVGASPFAKAGIATLGLTGDNSGFTGGWNLNAGGLSLGSPTALGSGPLVIANGTSLNSSVANLVNTGNNPLTINGDFSFTGTQGLNLGTGAVTLGSAAGTARVVSVLGNTLSLGGVIGNGATAIGLTKAGAGTLQLSGVNTYTGVTTIREGTLNVALSGNINVNANSPLGNTPSGTNIVLGTTTSSAAPILQFVAGDDTTNYTFSRMIDAAQGTGQISTIQFTGDGTGGVNSNTLTLEGDTAALYLAQVPSPVLAYSSRAVRFRALRSGLTINITGNIPAGTGVINLGSFPTDPGVDGRGVGTVRFSNLDRFFTGVPTLNFGTMVIDGAVGGVDSDSPIGSQTVNLNQGTPGNIVGNANFTANAPAWRDTSVDTIRALFLDSAGSSYARDLAPGGGGVSTQGGGSGGNLLPAAYGTGTAKTVSVINGYQFGGKNASGTVTFSGNIVPNDVAVGSHPTNVITTGVNIALIAETGGTVEFSGAISDTPAVDHNVRATINQFRNHPNIDGVNNTTLIVGPDGVPDITANQLVGTAQGGTVVLGAAAGNTYQGGTEILGGTLLANNTGGSATGSGALVVQAGGKLGGTGIVAPAGTNGLVVNDGASLGLEDAAAGLDLEINLAGTGDATFAPGAKLGFDVAASGTADVVNFTGLADSAVAFNHTVVDLTNVGGAAVGATYTLMNFDTPSKYTGTLVVGALPPGIAGATFGYDASNITVTLTGVAVAPAQPTLVKGVPGDTVVNLGWNPSARATNYTIKRSTTPGGTYTDIATVNAPATTYQDTGRTNGTTYYYVVTATAGALTSGLSAETSATPQPPVPDAPANPVATIGNTTVTLNWTAPSGVVGNYTVKRSTVNGAGYVDIATVNAPTTTYQDTGRTNGTTYYYVIAATNGGGTSVNSAQVAAVPQVAAPTGLSASAGSGSVTLNWTAPAGPVASYTIKRATVAGGPYTTISAGAVVSPTYSATGLTNGTTYYFVVAAVNGGTGTSPDSNEASATPGAANLLAQWRADKFTAQELANPALEATVWGDSADPDGDGLRNLVEYAFGTEPKIASASPVVVVRDASGVLKLSFPHIADAALVYTVKGTNDLAGGFGGAAAGTYTGFGSAGTTEYLDTGFPLASTPRRFLRLEVSRPE